ncbi:MAG: flagellar hook-basal body complex protein [Gluconacetobacter sp.]
MSVFNALTTAVSGINAQSAAFTNLSNNIANSQTVGYKATTTAFQDYVASSLTGNAASADISDSVAAVTVQHVEKQGTTSNSTDNLAVAVSGSGMLVVSKETGASSSASATPQFQSQNYYTRNGEIYKNNSGYLVNTSGYYLDGYMVDSKGTLGTALTQLNVANVTFRPTQTTTLTSTAAIGTLPSDPTNPTDPSTGPETYSAPPVTTYDAQGGAHQVGLTWTQSANNPYVWTVNAYDASGSGNIGDTSSATVTFNTDGTLKSVTSGTAPNTTTTTATGATASFAISAQYNGVTQNMTVDLGTIGSSSGTTLAAASATPTASGVDPLSFDLTKSATNVSLGSQASPITLGTTTGSNQSYMTAPTALYQSTNPTTGAPIDPTYVSASFTQQAVNANGTSTWDLSLVNPYQEDSPTGSNPTGSNQYTVNSSQSQYQLTFGPDGAVATITDITNPNNPQPVTTNSTQSTAFLKSMSVSIGGTSYTTDLSNIQLSKDTTVTKDTSSLTTDSIASGVYQGINIQSDGSVMAQFDTGTQLIGKIALANFANVNGLNAVDGQAYTATTSSGLAKIGAVGDNGTGTLAVGSVEASTTDLTSDLSALIVAQEAYSANTKIVTTADQLLQTTIAMKQ